MRAPHLAHLATSRRIHVLVCETSLAPPFFRPSRAACARAKVSTSTIAPCFALIHSPRLFSSSPM